MQIHLNKPELLSAFLTGISRHMESKSSKRNRESGIPREETGLQNDIYGAIAECVVAKALGTYWGMDINTFKKPDVLNFQVRATAYDNGGLIVRGNDSDDEKFVLVTLGDYYNPIIRGWLHGRDAKREKFKWNGNGLNSCYMVPQNILNGFDLILADH